MARIKMRSYSNSKNQLLGGIILLVVGIGVLIGGIVYANSINSKVSKWPHVTAVVSDYVTTYDTDRDIMYAEVLEYTVDGRVYKVKSSTSSNIPPVMGVRKEIAYNPDVPTNFVYADGIDKSLPMIIMFVIGGLFPILGIGVIGGYIIAKKKAKQRAEALGDVGFDGVDDRIRVVDESDEPVEKMYFED